ncbi:MAG: hypothetical protein Q9165_003175 [Trypethelium subeluteriae]
MSQLQSALSTLGPINFDDIPLSDLNAFMSNAFTQAETIANSVPPPPGGDDFLHSKPSTSRVNSAHNAATMTVSSARPPPPQPSHVELQKGWGKPMKVNPKENPLGISLYKMAGHDRHGAWFARSSVHEGLGFDKWRTAMKREFLESMAVEGGPGAGCVRGIGVDQRLDKKEVEGLGALEVFQLSAQFPGPVAPREFITLLLTSENCLTEASAPHVDSPKAPKSIPRHLMVVSKPCQHPDAPEREGYVRGQYESIELIREIPLVPSKAASTTDLLNRASSPTRQRDRGHTIGFAESRGPEAKGERLDLDEEDEEAELNPVQWIMVTRSDPGGGIPRFMVERGTPSSIISDASKFLNWACSKDFTTDSEAAERETPGAASQSNVEGEETEALDQEQVEVNGHLSGLESSSRRGSTTMTGQYDERTGADGHHHASGQDQGLMSQISDVVRSYAPQFVQGEGTNLTPPTPNARRRSSSSSSSSTSTSSLQSFADAEPFQTAQERPPPYDDDDDDDDDDEDHRKHGKKFSTSNLSFDSSASTETPLSPAARPTGPNRAATFQHDRELSKLEDKRRALDEKLSRQHAKEDARRARDSEKTEAGAAKARERHDREVRKYEEKHQKEMRKLEEKREKEDKKREERRRKAEEKDAAQRVKQERDGFRERVGYLEREVEVLRSQVGELQRENTALVVRLGKMEGGGAVLASVRSDLGKEGKGSRRESPRGSERSGKSGDTGDAKGSGGKDGKDGKGEELVGGQA